MTTRKRHVPRMFFLGLAILALLGTSRSASAQGWLRRGAAQLDPNRRGSGMNQAFRNFDRGTLPYRQELGNRGVNIADDYARTYLGLPRGQGGAGGPVTPPNGGRQAMPYPYPPQGAQPNYQTQMQIERQLARELARQREFEKNRWQQQQNFQMQQLRVQQQIARQQAEFGRQQAVMGMVGQIIGGVTAAAQNQNAYPPPGYYPEPNPFGGP